MNTTDNVLLIILTSLIGVLILVAIAVMIMALKVVAVIKRVVIKAEDVVVSVESATDIFKHTEGRLAFFKLVRNIIKLTQKRSK